MIKMMLQSMKCRKFKNSLLMLQFTIGFASLLFGMGCVNHVFQYKKNVEGLASLDTIHASVIEDEVQAAEGTMLEKYKNAFLQVEESGLTKRQGFFELLNIREDTKSSKTESKLYILNEDCIAMSNLHLKKGSAEPLKTYDKNTEIIPVIVSASMEQRYKMGESYPVFYVNSNTFASEKILIEVVGVLEKSVRFWGGGSTELSNHITVNRDFILSPQFIDFTFENTYSMNAMLQLSGQDSEKEKKLEQIQAIFEQEQMELQITTLQKEVDDYYQSQKVVFIGTLAFAAILLVLSLLGCIGAILAGITTRYREFGIYYSMGFTKKNMIYLVQGEIILLFGASFLIATGISKLFFELVMTDAPLSISFSVIFAAFLLMLVCAMLCNIMPFLKLRKMEPIEMIKGENG